MNGWRMVERGPVRFLAEPRNDRGPWARGMGPRMREDNGRGEGSHEGRPYGGRGALGGGSGAQ